MTNQPRTLYLAAVLFSRSRGDVAPFLPLAAVLPTMAGTNRHRLGTIRMQISAERRVVARREAVWAALNDLDTLCDCIPGCLRLQRLDDNVIAAESAGDAIGARGDRDDHG